MTPRQIAEVAADRIIAPLKMRQPAQRLRSLVAELSSLEERVASAERQAVNYAAPPSALWKMFAASRYPQFVETVPPDKSRAYLLRAYLLDFAAFAEKNGLPSLAAVTPEFAAAYFSTRRFTPSAHNNRVRALRAAFDRLAKNRKIVIGGNPFAEVESIREDRHRKQALTGEQLHALFAAAENDEWRAFLMTGFFTGLRRADVATLLWREIDFAGGIIVRCQNKLLWRSAEAARVGVAPQLAAALVALPHSGDAVFPAIAGLYRSHNQKLTSLITATFARAGMVNTRRNAAGNVIVDYGFHSLRHSFASAMLAAGAPLPVAQSSLGHRSAAMTGHYLHATDEQAREWAGRLRV